MGEHRSHVGGSPMAGGLGAWVGSALVVGTGTHQAFTRGVPLGLLVGASLLISTILLHGPAQCEPLDHAKYTNFRTDPRGPSV